jgi:adenine-specific DNA-methyltransferase
MARQPDLFLPVPTAPEDTLGEAYCQQHDAGSRRVHGITLTPEWLVQAMLDRLRGERFDTIVDAGAGSGRFALAAARAWPVARIVAVERHPAMAALLRRRLADAGLASRIEVCEQDFRHYTAPAQGRTLFLGNPPYVRHHDLTPDWKAWYGSGMAAMGQRASQLAGLHAHFMLHAVQQMRPGDVLCFVTAAEWLDNGYGGALRALFTQPGRPAVRGLWVAPHDEPVFADALVSAAVLLLSADADAQDVRLGLISRQALSDQHTRPLDALCAAPRWSPLCQAQPPPPQSGIELGELFHIVRGQVTGANEVFVLPPGQQLLPDQLTCAAVTRAREIIEGQVASAEGVARLKRVVDLPADLDTLSPQAKAAALAFIDAARRRGADLGYIATHRKRWFSVGMRPAPAAFVSYMGRRPPVFAANPWGVSYLNIAHGLYPRAPLAAGGLQRLLDHLNRATDLRSGRVYGGGLAKFEPSDIARLRVPPGLLLESAA